MPTTVSGKPQTKKAVASQQYIDRLYAANDRTPKKPSSSSSFPKPVGGAGTVGPPAYPSSSGMSNTSRTVAQNPGSNIAPMASSSSQGNGAIQSFVNQGNAAFGNPGVGSTGSSGGSQYSGEPLTGFAHQYAPGYISNVMNNPGILAGDVLKGMGINNPALTGMMGDQADVGGMLGFLMNGKNYSSDSDMINYMADYLKNLSTPGGSVPGMDQMIANILAAGGDPTSVLGQFLGLDNSKPDANALGNQTKGVNSALSAAMNSANPYFYKAMQNMLDQSQQDYQSQAAHTGGKGMPGNYVQFLAQHGLGNYF